MLPRTRHPIVLRRLRAADLADFQAYRTDPQVGLYQGWLPMSDDDALAFLANVESAPLLQPGHWTQIAIASAEGGRLMGDIGLFVSAQQDRAEIGFTLAPIHQGQGIATHAALEALDLLFEHTPVQQVIAVTDARNASSMRLLQRLGMTLVSSAEALFRGQPCIEHTCVLERVRGVTPGPWAGQGASARGPA